MKKKYYWVIGILIIAILIIFLVWYLSEDCVKGYGELKEGEYCCFGSSEKTVKSGATVCEPFGVIID
ncbi:MAG: hypothetical protein GTN36_04240 [Candidatus Aenigmarchaeota archaeon]|nr:hypothetical protein [Candidatus Aenigmarchaeota archaeon]